MRFLFNLFRKTEQQLPSPTLSLNERNRLRFEREKAESEALSAKAKKESDKRDREYQSHVAKVYLEWVNEFQYQIHKLSDDSKFEIVDGELFGVFCLGEYTFKATTELGRVNRHITSTKSTITIENEYMDSPMTFVANIVRTSQLVSTNHPDSFAKMILMSAKNEKNLIHMRKMEHDRAERKRLKREVLERNRQRNLAKRKSFVLTPKSELG